MGAPVIGLTTYREQAAWGVWNQRADVLPSEYAAAVEATGGVPVLLPPLGQEGAADSVVARLDGLVISGGADVDPDRYGAAPAPAHRRTGARTATPGRRRCWTRRTPPGCRCSGCAAACR